MPTNFELVCEEENVRLDVFLAEKLALTRTKVKDMIEHGHVLVNGREVKPSLMIKRTMRVTGVIPEEEPLSLVAQDIPLEILYEDEYFLAINKQADMVVHPSAGHASGTLVNAVLAYLGQTGAAQSTERIAQDTIVMAGRSGVSPAPDKNLEPRTSNLEPSAWDLESAAPNSALRPGIVHRLDKGTTGVILIAKDAKTQEMLSHMFKDRLVKKTYRAIIEGVPPKTQWRAEGNIGRHPVERKKMAVLKNGGRTAETDFKILQKLDSFTYVEAYPKTGRTHQIRVHLAHGGNPIAGDETYGRKAGKSASRPLLHAYRIEFAHPATGEPVKIEAPIPSDMEEFIDKCRI